MTQTKKAFYLVGEKKAIEIGLDLFDKFYSDLIDFESHEKISTESDVNFDSLFNTIVENGWFNDLSVISFYRIYENARAILTNK